MSETNEAQAMNTIVIQPDTRDKIIVTIEGQDWIKDLSRFGLTFDSSEAEVKDAIVPAIEEEFGVNIRSGYKMRKATNSQNIHLIPNSVAGVLHG